MALVSQGKAKTLQAPKSDVSLNVPDGVHAVLKGCVHTNHLRFKKAIPENECIISPMVEFHEHPLGNKENQSKPQYIIRIPHCIPDKTHWKYIKVRYGDISSDNPFTYIPKKKPWNKWRIGPVFYEIDQYFITIHTTHFTDFICSVCQNLCCLHAVMLFLFGSIRTPAPSRSVVEIHPFLCSFLYNIKDYRHVCTK